MVQASLIAVALLWLFGPACLASVLINQMTCYGWTWRPIPESEVNDDY